MLIFREVLVSFGPSQIKFLNRTTVNVVDQTAYFPLPWRIIVTLKMEKQCLIDTYWFKNVGRNNVSLKAVLCRSLKDCFSRAVKFSFFICLSQLCDLREVI